MIGTLDVSKCNAIERAIRTGIDSRLTFETTICEKDTLVAEFVGSVRGQKCILGSSLSLAKVLYAANISDWCSAVAIPVGGRCRDVAVPTSSREERGLTDYSSFGPPLLNQLNGSGIAVMVKKSNIVACLAQFVSALPHSGSLLYRFGTFGQVVCQLQAIQNYQSWAYTKWPICHVNSLDSQLCRCLLVFYNGQGILKRPWWKTAS